MRTIRPQYRVSVTDTLQIVNEKTRSLHLAPASRRLSTFTATLHMSSNRANVLLRSIVMN